MDDAIFSPDRGNAGGSDLDHGDQPTPFYGGSSSQQQMSQRTGPVFPMSREDADNLTSATSPHHSNYDSLDAHSGGQFIVPGSVMGHSSQNSQASVLPAGVSKFREAGLGPISEQRNRMPAPSNSYYTSSSEGTGGPTGGFFAVPAGATGESSRTMHHNSPQTTPPQKVRPTGFGVANPDDVVQHTDAGPANENNAHNQSELPPTYASLNRAKSNKKDEIISKHNRLTSTESFPNPHE